MSGFPRNVAVVLDETEALTLAEWLGGLTNQNSWKAAVLESMRDELTPKKPRTYPRRFLFSAGGAALLSRWLEEWDRQNGQTLSATHPNRLIGPVLGPSGGTLLVSAPPTPLWFPVPSITSDALNSVRKVVAALWSRPGRKRLSINEKADRLSKGFRMVADRRKADYARDIAFDLDVDAWLKRLAERGETLLTSTEPPPSRKKKANVRKPHED